MNKYIINRVNRAGFNIIIKTLLDLGIKCDLTPTCSDLDKLWHTYQNYTFIYWDKNEFHGTKNRQDKSENSMISFEQFLQIDWEKELCH